MTAPILVPTSTSVVQLASAKRMRVDLAFDPDLASQPPANWANAYGIVNLTPGGASWDKLDTTAYHNANPKTGVVTKRTKKVSVARQITGVWQRERFTDPAENAAIDRLRESADENKNARVMIFNASDPTEQAKVYIVDVTWDEQGGAAPDKGVDNFTLEVQGEPELVANPEAAAVVPNATAVSTPSAAAGTMVTITGTGFSGANSVKFGATEAEIFKVVSDTSIRAAVTGSAGAKAITVASPAGPDTTTVAFTITA